MAYGRKTGGRNFKAGQVANPNGRPKLTPEKRAETAKEKKEKKDFVTQWNKYKFDRNEFRLRAFKYLNMSRDNMQRFLEKYQNKIPSLDAWIIKIISEGIVDGDEKRLTFFLDNLLGKLPNSFALDQDSVNSWAGVVQELRDAVETIDNPERPAQITKKP